MLQGWRGHKAALVLRLFVLTATAYLLLDANAQTSSNSHLQHGQSSLNNQEGSSQHTAEQNPSKDSSIESKDVGGFTSYAAPLQPQCETLPVCSEPTLLDPYRLAAADVCPVSEPELPESAGPSTTGVQCAVCHLHSYSVAKTKDRSCGCHRTASSRHRHA